MVSSVTDKFGFVSGNEDLGDGVEPEVDVDIVRRREAKWLSMLNSWDKTMMREYRRVRERCRKGIPGSVRARAWLHLCGAKYSMEDPRNKGVFSRLCNSRCEQKW